MNRKLTRKDIESLNLVASIERKVDKKRRAKVRKITQWERDVRRLEKML